MRLAFTKMHACGNDFIVIDDRDARLAGRESALAAALCHRRKAIGADGLLLLRGGPQPGQFGMVFVNADGLVGEMCGNGARCLAAYIRRSGLAGERLTLLTGAGAVPVEFAGQDIVLHLPPASPIARTETIEWAGQAWRFDALDVGPPHVVCFVPSPAALAEVPVLALGRHVRHHPAFAPRGCNVNFVARARDRLLLRTYERGVEDETLGCGTGATAAALVAHHRWGTLAPVTVQTHSGECLTIDFPPALTALTLRGRAHFVSTGEIDPGLLTARDGVAP